MKLGYKAVVLVVATFVFAGCASSGPKFAEMTPPELNATELGRIYVYRSTALGAAVQPTVYLNEEPVGEAVPHGFFYVDRPAGAYTVRTSTEVKRTLSLTLEAGQTRYVRLGIAMGFFVGHVYPELVENPVGEKEIASMHYIGKESAEK